MSVTFLYQYPCTRSRVSLLLYQPPLQHHCTCITLSAAHNVKAIYYIHKGCFSKLAVHHGIWVHAGHCCLTVKCITFPLLTTNGSHVHVYQHYRSCVHTCTQHHQSLLVHTPGQRVEVVYSSVEVTRQESTTGGGWCGGI